jgi:hypothetical protein
LRDDVTVVSADAAQAARHRQTNSHLGVPGLTGGAVGAAALPAVGDAQLAGGQDADAVARSARAGCVVVAGLGLVFTMCSSFVVAAPDGPLSQVIVMIK